MTALHPLLALGAVGAVAVPLLIHLLLRRRRAPVPWGAMQFLVQAYRTQRRRLQLEQILLLATRCLLVLLLGLGLARLLFGAGSLADGARPVALTIVIDDSLTSGVQDTAGLDALDRHVASALDALDRLDPARGDRAALVTLSAPASARVWPPTPDLDGVRRALRSLAPRASAADFAGAGAIIGDDGNTGGEDPGADAGASAEERTLLLSEFRRGTIAPGAAVPGSADAPAWPGVIAADPAGDAPQNTWIGALTLERAVALVDPLDTESATVPVGVTVELGRDAASDAGATTVRFVARAIGGGTGVGSPPPIGLGEATASWTTGSENPSGREAANPGQGGDPEPAGAAGGIARVTATLELPKPRAGERTVYEIVARLPDDALAADNTRSAGLLVRSGLRVGLVVPAGVGAGSVAEFTARDWIELALEPGGELDPRTNIRARAIDPGRLTDAALAGLDAVIVLRPDLVGAPGWAALASTVEGGRTVMIFPPADGATTTWPDRLDEAFGWSAPLTREPLAHEPALGIEAGVPARADGEGAGIVGPIAAELPELLRGVRVDRSIAAEAEALGAGATGIPVLRLSDGRPALLGLGVGRGRLLLWTTSPDLAWTNLPARAVFVPLVQELVRGAIPPTVSVAIAGRPVRLPGAVDAVTRAGDDAPSEIDAERGTGVERDAGRLRLTDTGGRRVGDVLVQPDPRGARTDPTTRDEIARFLLGADAGNGTAEASDAITWLDPVSGALDDAEMGVAAVGEDPSGHDASLWLLAAAAALACFEPVLSRLIAGGSINAGRGSHGPARAGARGAPDVPQALASSAASGVTSERTPSGNAGGRMP